MHHESKNRVPISDNSPREGIGGKRGTYRFNDLKIDEQNLPKAYWKLEIMQDPRLIQRAS